MTFGKEKKDIQFQRFTSQFAKSIHEFVIEINNLTIDS